MEKLHGRIFETYKNTVRPHACNINNTAIDMAMEKYVHVLLIIICYRTRHACYVFVISAQVFSYPVSRKLNIQQTRVQQ